MYTLSYVHSIYPKGVVRDFIILQSHEPVPAISTLVMKYAHRSSAMEINTVLSRIFEKGAGVHFEQVGTGWLPCASFTQQRSIHRPRKESRLYQLIY